MRHTRVSIRTDSQSDILKMKAIEKDNMLSRSIDVSAFNKRIIKVFRDHGSQRVWSKIWKVV